MTDFEKKDAKNQEEVTLDYHDILQIASGIDEDGNPNDRIRRPDITDY